jgi:hypothetical protein
MIIKQCNEEEALDSSKLEGVMLYDNEYSCWKSLTDNTSDWMHFIMWVPAYPKGTTTW